MESCVPGTGAEALEKDQRGGGGVGGAECREDPRRRKWFGKETAPAGTKVRWRLTLGKL